uniref:hypothetical protein n=1 Tax=Dysosmobacter welbionis TaxID=2093857 RepID=UPI00307FADEA
LPSPLANELGKTGGVPLVPPPFLPLRFFQGMVPLIKVEQMLQKDDGCDRMAVAENLFDGWRECRYAEI